MIDLGTHAAEWHRLDPRVRAVVRAIEETVEAHGVEEIRVTSLLRAKGVHSTGRACDLSVRGWSVAAVRASLALGLARFPRTDGRVAILYESPHEADVTPYRDTPSAMHNAAATGPHLHVQVPEAPTPGWDLGEDDLYYGEPPERLKMPPMVTREFWIRCKMTPAVPAEGIDMQHPQRLGWASELPEGYYLDDLGQVRHRATGELVCGWSGRGHVVYLLPLPCPDPVSGAVIYRFVDRDTMRQFGKLAENSGRIAGQRGLQALVRRLLGMAFDILLGKVLR
jgi:hypothetical protein